MGLHCFVPRRRRQLLVWPLLGLAALTACGKKGPPLAPLSSVPGPPSEVSIRRKGDVVEIRFKVPGVNSDGRGPAHIDRVKAFALTGPGKGVVPPMFLKHATAVSDGVLVREPPPPPPEVKEGDPPPPPPPPRTDPGLDQGQQAIIIDQLSADSFALVPLPELEKQRKADEEAKRKKPPQPPVVTPPDLGPPLPVAPLRYYAVAGLNGDRKGTMSALVPVPVDDPPPAPAAPIVTIAEGRVDLKWEEPDGLRRPVIKVTLPPVAAPTPVTPVPGPTTTPETPEDEDETPAQEPTQPPPTAAAEASPTGVAAPVGVPAPAGGAVPVNTPPSGAQAVAPPSAAQAPTESGSQPAPAEATTQASGNGLESKQTAGAADETPKTLAARPLSPFPTTLYAYAVYEMPPPTYTPAQQQPGAVPQYPALLTPTPVATFAWSDARFEVGVERCYALRTVATTGTLTVESALSPPTCVKTADVFAPAAPKNLAAVASEGAINLIWEANSESDLAGYLVLRAVADGKFAPITPEPIKETTFRDMRVRPGIRYAYVVVAVDTAKPQNVSQQSNKVEETAR